MSNEAALRPPDLVDRDRSATRSNQLSVMEFATLDRVWGYNERRLLEPIGYISPVEFEHMYYQRQAADTIVLGVN